MTPSRLSRDHFHPTDIIQFVKRRQDEGRPCALLVITDIFGGTLRARGAMMAVCADGETAGYISNGCLDADIVIHAQKALKSGAPALLHYGEGSPFKDIQMPCGGWIKILVIPNPDPKAITRAHTAMQDRSCVRLGFAKTGPVSVLGHQQEPAAWTADNFEITYVPKLKLRIVGRGAPVQSLSTLALQAGFDIVVQSPEDPFTPQPNMVFERLTTPDNPPPLKDDPWTAVVLLFHDHDWESEILRQALSGPAFYIGALGSKTTHLRRCATLKSMNISQADIDKIHGPIGLVAGMRDANLIAVSALAEILDVAQKHGKL